MGMVVFRIFVINCVLVLAVGCGGGGTSNDTSSLPTDLSCIPDCTGKACGDDGCGGSCGSCGGGKTCNIGQCVGGGVGTWIDPTFSLTWQNPPAEEKMSWGEAKQYCSGLELDGGGWRLPTIGELRTLIRGCPDTATGGECGVTDSCLSSSCQDSCDCSPGGGPADGCYWPGEIEGPCDWYWSSLSLSDNDELAWYVSFDDGGVNYVVVSIGTADLHVRCLR